MKLFGGFMGKLVFPTLLIAMFLFSCVTENDDIDNIDETIYTGYTSSGEIDSCKKLNPGIACSLLFDEVEEQFKNDCKNSGFTTIQCSCNKYICVESMSMAKVSLTAVGLDINGNLRTCKAMPVDSICTDVVTEGDEFAYKCEDDGNTPFQCNCHDYICVPADK